MGQPQSAEEHRWGVSQIVTALVVIIVLVVIGFWLYSRVGGPSVGSDEQDIVIAEAGGVVAGFPADLIREDAPVVEESYAIAYQGGSISQPVVKYASKRTLAENVADFGPYLVENGWEIIREADPSIAPVTSFYATRGREEVNITFITDDSGIVTVQIAYVTKR